MSRTDTSSKMNLKAHIDPGGGPREAMKVFVSYSHAQSEWVWKRLEPCLRAGGADVLIDERRFVAGPKVIGQMDATQDQADRHILVLSKQYFDSPYCRHEMDRAIAQDPRFEQQLVLLVRRDDASLPDEIEVHNPLYVDLRNDTPDQPWALLLSACGVELGAPVPDWLRARDNVVRLLERDISVNLVVTGAVKWDPIIDDLVRMPSLKLANVDLLDPGTVSRRGLIRKILNALGVNTPIPHPPEDLPEFARVIENIGKSRLVLRHFDMVLNRPDYGVDLFAAIRFFVMDKQQLVLLAQSRTPFSALLPRDNPISKIHVETVELHARP
jgi:hypothetical protein